MSYSKILETLLQFDKDYLVGTHISPDSDAIGSSVALYLALESTGKNVTLFLESDLNPRFHGLVPSHVKIIHTVPDGEYVFVGVDCATQKRLCEENEKLLSNSIASFNIDHHTSNELWGETYFIDSVSPAAACIVYQILIDLKIDISKEIASLLYAGILDDTGFFRFSNTTANSLIVASKLVELGAKPADISNIIHFEVPKRVVKLRANALNTLDFYLDDKVAIIYITEDMLNKANCTSEDAEGLVDFARSVSGVLLAFFIRQIDTKKWKVSSRSKVSKYDVNQLAGRFGGGGHKMAAGFTLSGTLEECIQSIIKESKISLEVDD